MAFCDFVVKYNPATDSSYDVVRRILYSIIVKRLKAHKPCICFLSGDSGEGKSFAAIKLIEILCEIQGLDVRKFFNTMNVYTPLEYPTKIDKLLFDSEFKPVNMIAMHEAREVVKAKRWQDFVTQSVADVNAMSRSIKRLCIFIVSQFIRDITTDIRYTINFYIKIRRPKNKRSRLYFYVMWKDDRDLEKPKLRKRKLSGYLVYPNGKYRRYIPQYLEITKPSKDLITIFEEADREAKGSIIRKKLNTMLNDMKTEIGIANKKIEIMVDYYASNLESLPLIGKRYRGKWKLNINARKMHDLDADDAKRFEKKLNDKLIEKGIIEGKKEAET